MSDSLEDLVAAFLERRERGEAADQEALLREHPGRERDLRAALSALGVLEERLDRIGGAAPVCIGPYRVQGEIARGGMGRVLRAVDPAAPERPVALKLLDAPGGLEPRARERFRREAEILRSLDHPGVVRVLEVGAEDPWPWIAMELVEGRTLAAVLSGARRAEPGRGAPSRPFGFRQAAEIAAQLARAVDTVHAAGVLHRDVKPANVILTPEGRVVLVDFGLVRTETTASLTRTGDLLGTPQYMAPEQARGERADERTDVYGIGAVLYELLALRPPHGRPGENVDPLQILAEVRVRSPIRLQKLLSDLPRELERIVTRALAHRPARRYSTAAALARDLEAFLEGRAIAARPPGALERLDELWRHQRTRLPLALLFVLLSLGALFAARHVERRALERREMLVERALERWLRQDLEGARREARLLAEHAPRYPFTALLLALAEDAEPEPQGDGAAGAAARGWSALRAGRHDEALDALQRARGLAPEDPLPLVMLARAAELSGRHDLAAREYRAATERLPGRAAVHARLSAVHWARRDEAEAERAIRRAIELDPGDGAHWFALARILGQDERKAEGLAAAERGAELAGDAATKVELQILAAALDQAGRHEQARAVLRRVLDKRPGDPQALHNLAYSFMSDHHLREAIETCQELARTRSRSIALASMAWLHAGSNLPDCEECRVAYGADPTLLDPDLAESLALEALERNDADEVLMLSARIGVLLDRRERIQHLLETLLSREENDQRIARFERALRVLRR